MTLQIFRRRPKPFTDRLADIAAVMFLAGFAARIAWALTGGAA